MVYVKFGADPNQGAAPEAFFNISDDFSENNPWVMMKKKHAAHLGD